MTIGPTNTSECFVVWPGEVLASTRLVGKKDGKRGGEKGNEMERRGRERERNSFSKVKIKLWGIVKPNS